MLTKGFGSGAVGIWAAKLDSRTNKPVGKPTKVAASVTKLRWFYVAGNDVLFSGGEQVAALHSVPFDLENVWLLGPPRALRDGNPGGYGYLSRSPS